MRPQCVLRAKAEAQNQQQLKHYRHRVWAYKRIIQKSPNSEIITKHTDQSFISVTLSFWPVYLGSKYFWLNQLLLSPHPLRPATSGRANFLPGVPRGPMSRDQHKEERHQWARPGDGGCIGLKLSALSGMKFRACCCHLGPKLTSGIRAGLMRPRPQVWSIPGISVLSPKARVGILALAHCLANGRD